MTKKAAKPAPELILDKPLLGCPRGRVFKLDEGGGIYYHTMSDEERAGGNLIRYTFFVQEVQTMGKDWFKRPNDYTHRLPSSFRLGTKEQEEVDKFQAAVKEIYGEYGLFTYSFTPNGIGDGVSIYSKLANTTKDVTDIDSW